MPKSGFHVPLGYDDLRALGLVTVRESQLGYVAENFIWHLLGVEPKVGRTHTANLSLHWRLEKLSDLVSQTDWSQERIADVTKAVDEAKEANESRHKVIHAVWTLSNRGTALGLKYRRGKGSEVQRPPEPVPPGEIDGVAGELKLAAANLMDMFRLALSDSSHIAPDGHVEGFEVYKRNDPS